jgi:hypothetical protein
VPRKLLLLPPILFGLHVLEEAPGYVQWFNSVAQPPIPAEGFGRGQIAPLAEAAVLAGLAFWTGKRWAAVLLYIWSIHFFFANGVYHLIATIVLRSWSPGLVTGTLLYLPFFAWLTRHLRRSGVEAWALLLIVALLGLPMYLQTYMVAFRHARFF